MVLHGTIHPEIYHIYRLLTVRLGGNQLTGKKSSTIGYPSCTLRDLGLEKNCLCVTTPSSIGELFSLEGILDHTNLLTGTIPSKIAVTQI